MAQHDVFKRFALVFTRINRGDFPSFKMIRDFLIHHGISVSERSIQRDIEQLRMEFGLDISFDRGRQGYFLHRETGRYLDIFIRFLDAVNSAELLAECMREGKKSLRFISFDTVENYGGTQHLSQFLNAIRKRKVVKFSHTAFETAIPKDVTVRPYLLKEYQGRWYVLCNFAEGKKMYSYGLDRVKDVIVTSETFDPGDFPDPNKFFEKAIGINQPRGKPEEVILSLTPDQGKYVKTLPLHRTQKIISESKDEHIISLEVVPNLELIQKIMTLCERVKVIKPPALAKEIKRILKETLKKYQ